MWYGQPQMATTKARKKQRTGTVALLGRPNVGKSTLLNALLGETIAITSHHPQTTRDQILGVVTEGSTQLVFIDTPGVHEPRNKLGARMNHLARDAAREADVVLFLTEVPRDLGSPFRPTDLEILSGIPEGKPVICLVNKIDELHEKSGLIGLLTRYMAAYPFAAIIPISAKKRDGLKGVLAEAAKSVPEGEHGFDDDALSDKPVRFFVAEFVRDQILRRTREEVPHGVAVIVDSFDEAAKLARIDVSIHVDKESHKPIIIGAGGSSLKAIGSEARMRVEKMLGRRVHLQLWVRVTPGWYESDSALRDMGYGPVTKEP